MAEAAAMLDGAGGGEGGDGGQGAGAPDWLAGAGPDELQLATTNGWKSSLDVIKAYRGAEKLIGKDPTTLLSVPKEGDQAAWDAFYAKLGRPGDAKDYAFEMPEKGGSEDFANWAKPVFHKLGLTAAQAKGLSQEWNKYVGDTLTKQGETSAAALAADKAELLKAWGAEESDGFKNSVAVAAQAARAFGVDGETLDKIQGALGLTATMKLFHTIGTKLGEPGFAGDGGGGDGFRGMTPEKAKAEIRAFFADGEQVKDWQDNRRPGHKEAMDRLTQLHKIAFPEEA